MKTGTINYNFSFATDLLIFSIDSRNTQNTRALPQKHLSLLLVKRTKEPYKDKWCLPGGFVKEDESSQEASIRVLEKETGLKKVYMEQLYTFDNINRDPRGRVISTAYTALINKENLSSKLREEACWFDVEITETKNTTNILLTNSEDKINIKITKKIKNNTTNEYQYETIDNGNLSFDHALIINKAIVELKNKVKNTDIVFNLMPECFTIGELKQVYELLLGQKLINAAFRRTIADKVESTNSIAKTGGHRPSTIFKYKNKL